jgi:CspA family cold shock protein
MARKSQQQQDETRYCENCGISFIWTVEEQRASALVPGEQEDGNVAGDAETQLSVPVPLVPPDRCLGCRYLLPSEGRERGLVKWYHRRKGYGFITRNGSPDLYVNRSALRRGHLMPGELVEFSLGHSPQGLAATHVTVVAGDSTAY